VKLKCGMILTDKWDDILSSIEAYGENISIWLSSNMVKYNADKPKFIVFIIQSKM